MRSERVRLHPLDAPPISIKSARYTHLTFFPAYGVEIETESGGVVVAKMDFLRIAQTSSVFPPPHEFELREIVD